MTPTDRPTDGPIRVNYGFAHSLLKQETCHCFSSTSRFSAYIERVRFLEADNKRLQKVIGTLIIKFEELDAILHAIYDAELAAARKALDETTAAKAAVEIKVRRKKGWGRRRR